MYSSGDWLKSWQGTAKWIGAVALVISTLWFLDFCAQGRDIAGAPEQAQEIKWIAVVFVSLTLVIVKFKRSKK